MRSCSLFLIVALVSTLCFGQAATQPGTKPTTHPSTRPVPAPWPEITGPLPTTPGDYKLKLHARIDDHALEMSVLLHLPPGYKLSGPRFPLLMFLHGAGEAGTDLSGMYFLGPMSVFRPTANARMAQTCPFVIVCPQCPPRGQRWDQPAMIEAAKMVLDDVIAGAHVDADRVYLTGLSLGGMGTWKLAFAAPDRFAAIAPMSAMAYEPVETARRLATVPVWSVVGNEDEPRFVGGTHQMNNALAANPVDVVFNYLNGEAHGAWGPAYSNPGFYEWLLAHHRGWHPSTQGIAFPTEVPSTQPVAEPRPSLEIPPRPGHYLLTFNVTIGNQFYPMDYLLFLPQGYHKDAAPKPAMLFLHETDSIGQDMAGLCPHGPDAELERPPKILADTFPLVVISPRLPMKLRWTTPEMRAALLKLLDYVGEHANIDMTRISVSGINGGATAACELAGEYPTRFAAAAPVVCNGGLKLSDEELASLHNLPGWGFTRSTDPAVGNTLKTLGWQITRLSPPPSAITPAPIDTSAYANRVFLEWLVKQHQQSRGEN